MSTFGGFMPEFPHIRVDFFRKSEGLSPPLACFLSHVHSDHLAGLESLKSPFIYCSAATRAILLRLERYPHRINFEKGICESRKQHYKHLRRLLKPIPLQTPTCIELAPGNEIQVTLFDANHCTGAVMLLIEGSGKAVLYTGDIRAEPWFVNTLARNPCIIEYTSGLKTLDCIYLDTSFTDPSVAFPTKAEGLVELLQKISKYPKMTEFHFSAWTFGYEEVWMALSRYLQTPVHVDRYKMRLYQSLSDDINGEEQFSGLSLTPEAAMLTGHRVGNTDHPGILTLDHTVRLHSCEKGIKCKHLGDQTVWIKPIIARTSSGHDICEIGVGGGGGDLNQRPEIELDNDVIITKLMEHFAKQGYLPTQHGIRRILLAGLHSNKKKLILDDTEPVYNMDELPLEELAIILARSALKRSDIRDVTPAQEGSDHRDHFPKVVTFPYSRHSSFAELRSLVAIFRPADVYPCTVSKGDWHEAVGIRALFGDLCSEKIFRHDLEMRENLLDTLLDETPKSWDTSSDIESQSGSEEIKHQNTTFDREHEVYLGVEKINNIVEPLGICEEISHHIYGGCSFEQGLMKDSLCLSDGDSQPEVEETSSRRKARKDATDVRTHKCPCVQENNSKKPQISVSNIDGINSGKKSQPAVTGVPGLSYYDQHDSVYRCQVCGWEVWGPEGGCTGCDAGEHAYCEITDSSEKEARNESSELKPRSKRRRLDRYARTYLLSSNVENDNANIDEIDADQTINIPGENLDGPSAYDSTSSYSENEYEMNGFIDDSFSDRGHDITNDSLCDDNDSKARHEQRSSEYGVLGQDHVGLIDLATGVESPSGELDLPLGDYGDSHDSHFEVAGLQVLGSLASEVIIPEVQGDSQSSTMSSRRLRTRIEAYFAAPEGWHNVHSCPQAITTLKSHKNCDPIYIIRKWLLDIGC